MNSSDPEQMRRRPNRGTCVAPKWGVRAVCASCLWLMGCLVTDRIEVEEEPLCSPSIVSPPGADHPLDQIVRVVLRDGTELDGGTAEERFQVTIRDCNVDQDLEAVMLLDARPELGGFRGRMLGDIRGNGSLERDFDFVVDHSELAALRTRPEEPSCHKVELRVGSRLNFAAEPEDRAEFASAVWWVAIPVGILEPELRDCP